MEYIPLGDLGLLIEGKLLSERDVQEICYQILEGIKVMHRLDFVHRDITAKASSTDLIRQLLTNA